MAASGKYDVSSSSPDGSGYVNGPRGAYSSALLEKSGSFREGVTSSLAGISRPNSASPQRDSNSLLQSLVSDLRPAVLEQKYTRSGEVKRSISNIIGISSEDSIPATFSMRATSSSALEEIRRVRNNVSEGSLKARDRVKIFGEATSKIDKYFNSMPRKRSRADVSSSERPNVLLPGGSTPRGISQSHLIASGIENGTQKLEERGKSGVPSRRVRTARVDPRMDARTNGITRPSAPIERDKEVSKLVNGATASEEKGRALSTAVDGWEKSKMKKKRSVIKSDVSATTVSAKPLEGDREPRRGIQQKLTNDARPRINNTHGFRSGPVSVATGVGKSDSTSQQNGIGIRPFPRNAQDNCSLPNDKRDRPVGSDKDGAVIKASNKTSSREDSYAASPTGITQVNTSVRGPRSSSGSLLKASPDTHRATGNSDDWENLQGANKLNTTAGAIHRKRSAPTSSPSPPVTQWGGQRPQKITRVARRSNLTPIISMNDEISASDTMEHAITSDDGAFTRRSSSSVSQQSKSKGDHMLTSGLSENEESGASDSKSKDKGLRCSELEEREGQAGPKLATLVLPSRKSKLAIDEDLGEGFRKQGRVGRGFAPRRSGMTLPNEKVDGAQWRNGKNSSEKIESKPGRPPTKKWSERKGSARPRHSMNNGPIEFAGSLHINGRESDDDHEELLAAANAALGHACSDPFWKQMNPVFSFVSSDDVIFLNRQLHMCEAAASTCIVDDQNFKGDRGFPGLPSTPALAGRDDSGAVSNKIEEYDHDIELGNQAEFGASFLERVVRENGAPNGISVCQALLSAIIEEDEIASFNHANSKEEDYLLDDVYGIHFEAGEEFKLKGSELYSLGTFQDPERAPSNGYMVNEGLRYHAGLANGKLSSNGAFLDPSAEGHAQGEQLLNQTMACVSTCTGFDYNQMCVNDRILLELSELGLYPEPVPDLSQSEEEIGEGIKKLEEKLHEQVMKKSRLLSKLGKSVMEARESQQRVLERIALDKLVGVAYEKYMACWGPNASGSKNVNKATKHAALSFVRRTLIRYRKFEETGTSCFNEPAFRDIFLSVSSCTNGAKDLAADGKTASNLAPNLNRKANSADFNTCITSKAVQRVDIHGKYSDSFRPVDHMSEQMLGREDPWTNKVKTRELSLDDLVGDSAAASLRGPSGVGSSLVSGAKGKRSEREGKGQNRETASRNGTTKIGNAKGDRKSKAKSKQRTAQLSASVNGLLSKSTEVSNIKLPLAPKSRETSTGGNAENDDPGLLSDQSRAQDMPNDPEAIDLSNLQLPELDADFGGQGQDIGSWLNIDDDGLQDLDFMGGLEIPMDDLSEVNMMI